MLQGTMFRCFTLPNKPAITNMTLVPGMTDEYTMEGYFAEVFFAIRVCSVFHLLSCTYELSNIYFGFIGYSQLYLHLKETSRWNLGI